jgi:hypothetical protein
VFLLARSGDALHDAGSDAKLAGNLQLAHAAGEQFLSPRRD